MRVALFVHCFFPDHFYGTETYTLQLARNLLQLGHDPIVVSAIFPGEPGNVETVSQYDFEGIPVYCIDKNRYPNARVKDTYYQPEIRHILLDLLNTIRPDIVHVTHLINHTGVLLEAAHSLELPLVATLTDFFGFCFNNKLEAADGSLCEGPNARRTNCLACYLKASSQQPASPLLLKLAQNPALATWGATAMACAARMPGLRHGSLAGRVLDITRRPDILASCYANYQAAIAPTRLLKQAYLRNGFKAPIHEILFGVDLARAPKPVRPRSVPIRFGFIGQIAVHKGVDMLVEAFCRLPAGSAELHIYGSGEQYPRYMATLRKLAANHPVFFDGTFPSAETENVLAEMDFLVMPSRWYENSPLALLCALASHTPVIVSDVEGMTEFVEPDVNGWIFERENADDLERVLREIIASPDQARALTHSTEYPRTTAMMVRDVLAVYETLR